MGSNLPTRSIIITQGNYGIKSGLLQEVVGQKLASYQDNNENYGMTNRQVMYEKDMRR